MIPKVSSYNINSYNSVNHSTLNNKPVFTSLPCFFDDYTDTNGISRSTQHTTDLREDLDYKNVAKIIHREIKRNLRKNFKNNIVSLFKKTSQSDLGDICAPKVNIYCMAGSDGTEAYALANAIIEEMGFKKAKKYVFPIKVSDACENIIEEYGKKGIIYFYDDEINKLKSIKKYLKPTGNIYNYNPAGNTKIEMKDLKEYEITQEFRDCFTFETADFQEKIKNFPLAKKNEFNIILIRNCLTQSFGSIQTTVLLNDMPNHLPSGSLVIFGDYDTKRKMPLVFQYREGLFPIDTKNNIFMVERNSDELLNNIF